MQRLPSYRNWLIDLQNKTIDWLMATLAFNELMQPQILYKIDSTKRIHQYIFGKLS